MSENPFAKAGQERNAEFNKAAQTLNHFLRYLESEDGIKWLHRFCLADTRYIGSSSGFWDFQDKKAGECAFRLDDFSKLKNVCEFCVIIVRKGEELTAHFSDLYNHSWICKADELVEIIGGVNVAKALANELLAIVKSY